ncbi:TetR/AcrR family transcriptional regulator [Lutimonas sp.]|uniref:TetR/AcrR family transcriptional regulator n=1 Tax=Lutimonas sp. TaxID=1872403 RepID=UPI003D9AB7FF
MAVNISITLNPGLYLKDPQQSELGKRIIKHSILLIDELGFELFNFKKLAEEMKSTEASIYRYFENKHLLLTYLVSWYWEWLNYMMQIKTFNIEDPKRKLEIIIHTFVSISEENPSIDYVNESSLHNVVIAESTKVYHTKSVDEENIKGFFLNYKEIVSSVAEVILEIKPEFPYPHALASNLYEMTNNHFYFADHLPRLTDISKKGLPSEEVEKMLLFFISKMLA